MQIKKGKLAIIAGGGDLVLSSIKSCKTQNINYFLIGIKDFYKDLTFSPDAYLSLNNIGNIFSILYKEKIKYIIFIGKVNKPSLLRLTFPHPFGRQPKLKRMTASNLSA